MKLLLSKQKLNLRRSDAQGLPARTSLTWKSRKKDSLSAERSNIWFVVVNLNFTLAYILIFLSSTE